MATLVSNNDHDLEAQSEIRPGFQASLQDLAIDELYSDEVKSLLRKSSPDIKNGGHLDKSSD
jgi:hypothetical protein